MVLDAISPMKTSFKIKPFFENQKKILPEKFEHKFVLKKNFWNKNHQAWDFSWGKSWKFEKVY